MLRAEDKAAKMLDTANYWAYRADGVERHANRKADSGVRLRRIASLLSDLRGFQCRLNFAAKAIRLWERIDQAGDNRDASALHYAGAYMMSPPDSWQRLRDGEITIDQVIAASIEHQERVLNSEHIARWIMHLLNRIGYERDELGPVPRFTGEITPVILQTFCREQGADKPKGKRDGDKWEVSSPAPLPLHIGDSERLSLAADEWRDLFQQCGHVPTPKAAKPKKPSLLNLDVDSVTCRNKYHRDETITYPRHEMTKAEYGRAHGDYKGTAVSDCGRYRIRTAMISGSRLVYVYLTDSKTHEVPAEEAAA